MLDITECEAGLVLPVRASPGSRRDAITGEHAGALKVSVIAPPDKGKANEAIVQLLSDVLKLPKSNISLLSGPTSRQKKFSIAGLDRQTLLVRLEIPSDKKSSTSES